MRRLMLSAVCLLTVLASLGFCDQRVLTVSREGEGTITSSPAGIACGGSCSALFDAGTSVTLTATPEDGWLISGWICGNPDDLQCQMCELMVGSAHCADLSLSCTLTMTEDITMSVIFERGGLVKVEKVGSGTVVSSPAGVNCGCDCDCSEVFFGDVRDVTLTAIPAVGGTFLGWGGDCSGTETTCVVDTSHHRNVIAEFTQGGLYMVSIYETGAGNITSMPVGIDCGVGRADCSALFEDGTEVTYTVTADDGWAITGIDFGGRCNWIPKALLALSFPRPSPLTTLSFSFPILEPEEIRISFGRMASVLTVSSRPGGIVSSPGEGAFQYDQGTSVPIAATPDPDYRFVNWTGTAVNAGKVANPTAASTTVAMDGDYTLMANFEPQEVEEKHTLTLSSTAGGRVSSPGEGTFEYDEGTSVQLQAEADPGYHFTNWSGSIWSTENPTTITMDQDYQLTANFEPEGPANQPPATVLSPVIGDLEVVSSLEDCSGTKWCFNQHKGSGHGPGEGICRSDDTCAWDINLNYPNFDSDKGKPVFAVAEGKVCSTYGGCTNAGGSYGQVVIEHSYQGSGWWSGYLHLRDIQVAPGETVDTSTLLGYISNTSPAAIPNHLHFVVYTGANTQGKLVSFDATIAPRPETRPPSIEASVTPYGSFFSNYIVQVCPVSPGEFVTAKIADSASLPIEVRVTSAGVPVVGAEVEISEGSFHLGVTDEDGVVKGAYPITPPPLVACFTPRIHIGIDPSIQYSTDPIILYSCRLLGTISVEVTQDEAQWYPASLLLQYQAQPGIPGPEWSAPLPVIKGLAKAVSMLDLLVRVKVSLNDYEPRAGDICRFEAFEYTAPGVETAYAVHLTVERGGAQIYNRTQWTDKYELVKPIALVKLARNAIVGSLACPVNFWVTDSGGNNAGVDPETGELVFEFPMAITPLGEDHAQIVIPDYTDGQFQISVVGTGEGAYSLLGSAIDEAGHVWSTFSATDVPTAPGITYEYAVDWQALSEGESGVTISIDADNDGHFEKTFVSDAVLTRDEMMMGLADFDLSGIVDFNDLRNLADDWLSVDCQHSGWCEGTDLNWDGKVDARDLATFAQVWRCGPQMDKPVAHWTFDEGTGFVANDSAGSNPGSVHGAKWMEGIVGGALLFDGINDYVDCGNAENLAPEQLTISAWIQGEGFYPDRYIVSKVGGDGFDRDYSVTYLQDLTIEFRFGESYFIQARVKSSSKIATGQWTHVAVTRDGSQAALYINGVLQGSQTYSFVPQNKRQDLVIGAYQGSSSAGFFKGMIDDVRIYDQALSAEEIQAIFNEQ